MGKKTFGDLTTFKTGGKIFRYAEVDNELELITVVKQAKQDNLTIFIIGGGSDILASDKDFSGLVIKYIGDKMQFSVDRSQFTVTAQAGLEWDKLVVAAVKRNLQGVECLSGIPGTVGAAPIQNIGAYGQELNDVFVSLKAYDIKDEKFVNFSKADCKFGYRESIFKNKKYWQKFIITEITLKLNKDKKSQVLYDSLKNKIGAEESTLIKVRKVVIKLRREKLEDWKKTPNAGSYFKNPIITKAEKEKLETKFPEIRTFNFQDKHKIAAGWLIEQTGWKGKNLGQVKVSDKHALILTNPKGEGKSEDVIKLAEAIQNDVYKKFKVKLEPEVQYINF